MCHIVEPQPRGQRLWDLGDAIKVKVCRIETLEVAYDAALAGVDALGYHIMNPDTALAKAEMYRGIIEWLPPDVANVLVTRLTDIHMISSVIRTAGFDSVQIQTDLGPEEVKELRLLCRDQFHEIRIIKTVWVGRQNSPEGLVRHYLDVVDGFLVDSGSGERGGTGRIPDWSKCREFRDIVSKPVLLAGGLNSENVGEAISIVKPFGVDIQSGVEHTVRNPEGAEARIKSVTKIVRFIEAAKGKRPS